MLADAVILALMPFYALVIEGLRRKLIARMQNRQGPPVLQPFYDVIKLFQKQASGGGLVFRAVPYLALINALALLAFVPLALIGFEADFIVFGYLFILLDTLFLIGVFASKSPFGFHASVRELLLMVGYEIGFLVALGLFLFKLDISSLALFDAELMLLQMPVASIGLLAVGLVILRVTPFDVVVAEPEIGGGLWTEYFGRHLALLELAEWIKNLAFYLVLGVLLLGRAYAIPAAILFAFVYAFSQVSSPRYSTFKSAKLCVIIAIVLFIDLVFLV